MNCPGAGDRSGGLLLLVSRSSGGRHRLVHVHAHGQPGLGHAIAAGCDVVLHGAAIDDAALEAIALETGQLADLLVVEGDPLVDIRVLAREDAVVLVIKDGRIEVDRLRAEARSLAAEAELAAL